MNISHVISSIDISSGGPARSVTHLIEGMLFNNKEIKIELNTLKSPNTIIRKFKSRNGTINFHDHGFFTNSKSLKKRLNVLNSDIYHGHGLWQLPVHKMAKLAKRQNKPYIISIRGMLEPWALLQGKIKKKLALKLFQYADLKKAAFLHATSPMELESIRKLGLKNPTAIIPNGVNIDAFPEKISDKVIEPKKILFLSRIHSKKGIEYLIEAWSQIDVKLSKNWIIEIVGNGEQAYIDKLQKKINSYRLQEQIFIKPAVFYNDKIKLFREASLFVLPTHSENFGIVIAEALASFTPVITTKGTPWQELNFKNAGWWIDIGVEPLKQALATAIQTSQETLVFMGRNGRKLIEEKYSMSAVANQMLVLYDFILNPYNKKPNFIYYE